MNKWSQFLEEKRICCADDVGNVPCDNGAICNKCQQPWVLQAYKCYLEEKEEKK